MASWFSTQKTDPYGALNPEQRQVNQALGNSLMGSVNNGYQGNLYQGQLTAPIGKGEQNVVDNSARFNAVAGDTFNRLSTYDPNQVNSDFNQYVQDPTFSHFKNEIEPLLGEELPSFGTARAQVVARAANDLASGLSTQRMGYQQQAKDTALNAISGANTYNQGAAQIASIPRQIQQAGLDREYANFIQANQQKQNSLNQALNFLGISTGTTTQDPTTFGNLLSTAKSAAEIYGAVQGGGGGGGGSASNLQTQTAAYGGGTSNAWNNNGGAARAAAVSPNYTFSYA